jgi:hypothetical protein
MKKVAFTIISLLFIAIFSFITYAYTWNNDGAYHFECLHEGDKLKRYTCTSSLCIVCQKLGNTYPANYCSNQAPSCSYNNNNSAIDIKPPVINIVSPVTGAYFGTRAVPFNIQTDEEANIYYIDNSDTRRGWVKICSMVKSCIKTISLYDGPRNISVLAKDASDNEAKKTVIFTIDSQKPLIRLVMPKANTYSNGRFSIQYDEADLRKATLFWKTSSSGIYNQVVKTDCPKGVKQVCNFTVSTLPQGSINFYFKIEDAATPVQSVEQTVMVDTVAPVLARISPQPTPYAEKTVPFTLTVNEPVTLEYIDYKEARPKFKTLCKACTLYDRTVTFLDGNHSVEIRAIDNAGNHDSELVTFFVDSVDPKIKSMLPKDKGYTRGYFQAEIEEQNLKNAVLYYKESGKAWKNSQKTGKQCNISEKKNTFICEYSIALTAQGPLSYYFEASDPATSVQSKTFNITVDTVAPLIAVHSPTVFTSLRNAKFNITVSEPVTLGYMDMTSISPRNTVLCTKCSKYFGSKMLALGPHDIFFTATDSAGNSAQVQRKFTITS